MLYRSTDRLCRRGAPMQNLAHSASFESLDKDAPSKAGTKQLFVVAPRSPCPNPLESGLDCGPAHTGLSRVVRLHQRPLRLAAPRRLLRDNLGVNMSYDLIVLINAPHILPRPSPASMSSILKLQ